MRSDTDRAAARLLYKEQRGTAPLQLLGPLVALPCEPVSLAPIRDFRYTISGTMNVLVVTGSKKFNDEGMVRAALYGVDLLLTDDTRTGGPEIARRLATDAGIQVCVFRCDWKPRGRFDRRAGTARNARIGAAAVRGRKAGHSIMVLGLPSHGTSVEKPRGSTGTWECVALFRQLGFGVWVNGEFLPPTSQSATLPA